MSDIPPIIPTVIIPVVDIDSVNTSCEIYALLNPKIKGINFQLGDLIYRIKVANLQGFTPKLILEDIYNGHKIAIHLLIELSQCRFSKLFLINVSNPDIHNLFYNLYQQDNLCKLMFINCKFTFMQINIIMGLITHQCQKIKSIIGPIYLPLDVKFENTIIINNNFDALTELLCDLIKYNHSLATISLVKMQFNHQNLFDLMKTMRMIKYIGRFIMSDFNLNYSEKPFERLKSKLTFFGDLEIIPKYFLVQDKTDKKEFAFLKER